jgi:hypothetical protein
MADLVVGGVVNVLREIGIDSRQVAGVDRIAGPPRNFAILDSAQFVVLGIEVSLNGLSSR